MRKNRLKREQLTKFADRVKQRAFTKRKLSSVFKEINIKNLTHGFSIERRPKYNNTGVWMKKKKIFEYKNQKKKLRNAYPNRTVYGKFKDFSSTKSSWYIHEHKNRTYADKLFYMPIHQKSVPHLFQRHSESL